MDVKKRELQSCVFLQVGFTKIGDKRGVDSDEVEVDADKDLLTVRKKIFKHPSYDRIKSLDSEIRRFVRATGFPFEKGLHMVAQNSVDYINTQLLAYEEKRHEYIDSFVLAWPIIKEEFPPRLRKLWDEKDYNIHDVRGHFSMYWNFFELQVPLGLEQINSDLYKAEKGKFRQRMDEAYEQARMILRETCLRLVTHLRLQLQNDAYGAPKKITQPTVDKLKEFVNTLPMRNITNDTELGGLVTQMNDLLTGVNADYLRNSDYLRHEVRNTLTTIEHQLTEAIQVAPTRRIRPIATT